MSHHYSVWFLLLLLSLQSCNEETPAISPSNLVDHSVQETFNYDKFEVIDSAMMAHRRGWIDLPDKIKGEKEFTDLDQQYFLGLQCIDHLKNNVMSKADSLKRMYDDIWNTNKSYHPIIKSQNEYIESYYSYRSKENSRLVEIANKLDVFPEKASKIEQYNWFQINTLAGVYWQFRDGNRYKANTHFKLIYKNMDKLQFVHNRNKAILLNNLSSCSRAFGNYERSIAYAKEGIQMLSSLEEEEYWQQYLFHSLLVYAQAGLRNFEEVLANFNQAVTFIQLSGDALNDYLHLKFNTLSSLNPAFFEDERAKKIFLDIFSTISLAQVNQMPQYQSRWEEFSGYEKELTNQGLETIAIRNSTISRLKKSNADNRFRVTIQDLYLRNSYTFSDLEMIDSAIYYSHKSIEEILGAPYNIQSQIQLNSKLIHFNSRAELSQMAKNLMKSSFPTGSLSENKKLAWSYYRVLMDLFDEDLNLRDGTSVFRQLEDYNEIFAKALQCIYTGNFMSEREKVEAAFELMEKGKAILLAKSVKNQIIAEALKVPFKFQDSLRVLNEQLVEIEYEKTETENKSVLDSLERNYFMAVSQIDRYWDLIDTEFPNYVKAVEGFQPKSLEEVESNLEQGEQIVQYFKSDSSYFALTINSQHSVLVEIRSKEIDEKIARYGDALKRNPGENDFLSPASFEELGYELDQIFLEPLIKNRQISRLIVIRDGILNELPFEAFVGSRNNQKPSFFNINYRIRDWPISYAYSASILMDQQVHEKINKTSNVSLFAFSDHENVIKPDFKIKEWGELPGTSLEVDGISQVLKDYDITVYKGDESSNENMLNALEKSDLLHLAIHSISDSRNRFGNRFILKKMNERGEVELDSIFSYEFYKYSSQPQLIYLSSCESAAGVNMGPEGVYSLGRSLARTGINSVVMNLWNSDDQTSSSISKFFYQALTENYSLDRAMQRAKMNYLIHADEQTAHPYFWSATILNGSCENPLVRRRWWDFWNN